MYSNQNINTLENIKASDSNILLDVRTAEEFANGHIDGAINIDVMSNDFVEKIATLDKSLYYFVICRSGGRSGSACTSMSNLGFTNLTNMDWGMMGWVGKVVTH
jgi:rhodanese-related sulfurtransferase